MVYMNSKSENRVSILFRVFKKICKLSAKKFPLNRIRILSIRLYGYSVGKQVYIGEDFLIIDIVSENSTSLKIHDRVAIAPRVTVVLASFPNWSKLTNLIKPIKGNIILKNDCWIGTSAVIMPSVTIGEGAIVAAGAIVTKDVDDFTIVAGIPAKPIGKVDNTLK